MSDFKFSIISFKEIDSQIYFSLKFECKLNNQEICWITDKFFSEFRDLDRDLHALDSPLLKSLELPKEKKSIGWFGKKNVLQIYEDNRNILDNYIKSFNLIKSFSVENGIGSTEIKKFIKFDENIKQWLNGNQAIDYVTENEELPKENTSINAIPPEIATKDFKTAAQEIQYENVELSSYEIATEEGVSIDEVTAEEKALLYEAIMSQVSEKCNHDENIIKQFKKTAKKFSRNEILSLDYVIYLEETFDLDFTVWLIPNLIHLLHDDSKKTGLLKSIELRQKKKKKNTRDTEIISYHLFLKNLL